MANELALIEPERYPALIDGSEIREAIIANTRGEGFTEADLTRVPVPTGGGTTWTIPGISGDETTDAIVGILVYFQPRGVLWPTMELEGSGQLPLLLTNDLITARMVGDYYGDIDPTTLEPYRNDDGTYDWAGLTGDDGPFGWGTGKNGVGKRAKEGRLMMILREGEGFPLVVNAPPGSLRAVSPFIKKLPVAHYRAVVSLGLEPATAVKGQKYARITAKLVGTLDAAMGKRVEELYTTPLRKMAERGLRIDAD